jgi:hemerythrin
MDFELGNANVSVELLHLLRNWLTNHIMKSDKTLGKALSDKGYK